MNRKVRLEFGAGLLAAVATSAGAEPPAPQPTQAGIDLTGVEKH